MSVQHAKITNPSSKPDTMDPPKKKSRSTNRFTKLTKTNSKKIVDKITYNPIKHKQSATRTLRAKLQQKNIPKSTMFKTIKPYFILLHQNQPC